VLNGELVSAEEIERSTVAWNGRPWVVPHPMHNGEHISANRPDAVEKHEIGRVFGAHFDGGVKAEVWTDIAKAQNLELGREVLARLKAGQPIEVSTAYHRKLEVRPGTYNGVGYSGIARNLLPDHLAALPHDMGACSWADGCGAPRINQETYQPPEAAQNNAKKVLRWREEHPDEIQGMTEVGWRRARQLASGDPISLETVKKMAQFNRHRENAEVAEEYRNEPWRDAGYVAWLGWGGTTGINWAIRVSEREATNEMSDNAEGVDVESSEGSRDELGLLDGDFETSERLGARAVRALARLFGVNVQILSEQEVRMNEAIERILEDGRLALNREQLEQMSDCAVEAMADMLDAIEEPEPVVNEGEPEEEPLEQEGDSVEFDAASALDEALADVGGIDGLKEALVAVQANAGQEKALLVADIAANSQLEEGQLQAMDIDALKALRRSLVPPNYVGRGGGPQANAGADEIEPLRKPSILGKKEDE
jgi:hypothetical protein